MIKTLQKDMSFSHDEVSHDKGKTEFVSQFTCLQPHLYVKYRRRRYNKQSIITVRRILTEALKNHDEKHFN